MGAPAEGTVVERRLCGERIPVAYQEKPLEVNKIEFIPDLWRSNSSGLLEMRHTSGFLCSLFSWITAPYYS